MIKINLLTVEKPRTVAAAPRRPRISLKGQSLTIGCALILVVSAGLIGWRYYQIGLESAGLDAAILEAQQETARLRTLIAEVQTFEQQRTQLQQRVGLIEQLRREQTGPVHMLDQISLAIPPMMWLTDLKQTAGAEVVIEGRCTGLTGLSDFVANLEASGYFKKSVEIVSTQVEGTQPAGDLIKFAVKAQFSGPATVVESAPVPPVAKPAT